LLAGEAILECYFHFILVLVLCFCYKHQSGAIQGL
jgi:hypothetical protein